MVDEHLDALFAASDCLCFGRACTTDFSNRKIHHIVSH